MARKFGKLLRGTKRRSKAGPPKDAAPDASPAFRVRFRGKDNAPLTMVEVRQGLLDAARRLRAHDACRVKWATLYLSVIDDDGNEVLLDRSGEWTLHPYKSAADEFGV